MRSVGSAQHAGEFDLSVTDGFRACLCRTGLDGARELVVDGARLDLVDPRGLESTRAEPAATEGALA